VKRKWFFRALTLFFVGVLCWMLIGVTINTSPKSPLQKLKEARSLWQSKGASDYKMTLSFGSFSYLGSFNVTVQENKVTHIDNLRLGSSQPDPTFPLDTELSIYKNTIGKSLLPEVSDYTMDNLFDFVSTRVKDYPVPPQIFWCTDYNSKMRYEAQYDAEYGYITQVSYTNCINWEIGGGLMCGVISDCSVNAAVRNFEILPSSQ
jgi:hypothetical protein